MYGSDDLPPSMYLRVRVVLVCAVLSYAALYATASVWMPGKTDPPALAGAGDGPTRQEKAPGLSALPPVMVIGFVGGYVRHDNLVHSVVQVATHLRRDYTSGVYVAVYENHRRERARQEILGLLDTNHDRRLSEEEKKDARIIIYGHSWGASEAVTLARELGMDGIPVLLTIQVDSISKTGQNDGDISANVAQAVNFYQLDGFLHGRPEIRAADAARTQILGNYRLEYKAHPLACEQYPWYDRLFMKAHTEIECDPSVWNRVESLIRSKLPVAAQGMPSPSPPRSVNTSARARLRPYAAVAFR